MANQPCQNPACHSCGKPHPNCKCASYMADGGMAEDSDLGLVPVNPPTQDNDLGLVPVKSSKDDDLGLVPVSKDDDLGLIPVSNSEKYGSTVDTIKAGLEGAAQGLLGTIAPLIETKVFNAKPEDIVGRAEAHPFVHGVAETATLAGSLLYGVGEAGLIARGAAKLVPETLALGKIGTGIIRGALESMSFAGSDEITKAILNQPGSDPEHPVAAALLHVGAAGIMGSIAGGVFKLGEGLVGKGLEKLAGNKTSSSISRTGGLFEDEKVSNGIVKYLADVGASGDPLGKLKLTSKINELSKDASYATSAAITGAVSSHLPIPAPLVYIAVQHKVGPLFEKITGKAISKANPYVTDAIFKSIAANEVSGVPAAIHFANQVGRGVNKGLNRIEALFKAGGSQLAAPVSDAAKEELKSFIEEGQVNRQIMNTMQQQNNEASAPQAFATGGPVLAQAPMASPPDRFANIFPEQNALLNTAKGRISNYLNGLRPLPNQAKLAFDDSPSDTEKKKTYDRALNLAISPIRILDHVNKGDLTPEDMKHFTSLYPEVHKYLSQQMAKRITEAQLKGEKPPYAKRQAMSLFLGTNLDTSTTPAAIQAAQNVFMQKQAAQQMPQPGKNKKGTSSLAKASQSYLTDDQAAQRRQQSVKS